MSSRGDENMKSFIDYSEQEWGVLLKIDRPEALNALNADVLMELRTKLELCEANKVKVVIITGAGEKAFVAGADIAAMRTMNPDQAREFSLLGQSVMSYIGKMKAVVIAAVNGYALGGGCELAAACDFRIASKTARFGIPEVSLGVIPGFGGTQRLSRLIGTGKTVELMATARQMNADEAYHCGLVNEVTEPDNLLGQCVKIAREIAGNSATAIMLGKQSILAGAEMDVEKGLAYEAGLFALTFAGEDQAEGMAAFMEKRKACFK